MSFSVTVLGSSSALPTSKRFTTAQVVNALERFFLLDCGEGTQIQLRKFKVRFGKINHILISHLHGDHFLGLFGLLSSFNLLGRQNPLTISGPPQLESMFFDMNRYMQIDLQYQLIFKTLNFKRKEVLFEDEKITVESFPVKHRIPTCGFIFREKRQLKNIRKDVIDEYGLSLKDILAIKNGNNYKDKNGNIVDNSLLTEPEKPLRSYAFCTDTKYFEKINEHIEKVDLLYHEATYSKNKQKQAKETYHSTTIDAGNVAKKVNAKHLIIGHFSSRYKNLKILLDETKSVFINTSLAIDGKKIEILVDKYHGVIIKESMIID